MRYRCYDITCPIKFSLLYFFIDYEICLHMVVYIYIKMLNNFTF